MLHLPPPDPNERLEPTGLELNAPAAIFLDGAPNPHADRMASAGLDWRPGALVVVTSRG